MLQAGCEFPGTTFGYAVLLRANRNQRRHFRFAGQQVIEINKCLDRVPRKGRRGGEQKIFAECCAVRLGYTKLLIGCVNLLFYIEQFHKRNERNGEFAIRLEGSRPRYDGVIDIGWREAHHSQRDRRAERESNQVGALAWNARSDQLDYASGGIFELEWSNVETLALLW